MKIQCVWTFLLGPDKGFIFMKYGILSSNSNAPDPMGQIVTQNAEQAVDQPQHSNPTTVQLS